MKNFKFYTMILALAVALPTVASAEICKVTDPTGTPLNVRATPNGKVIGKIKNGTRVYRVDYDYDNKGRSWVLVNNDATNKRIGWVFREFVSCY